MSAAEVNLSWIVVIATFVSVVDSIVGWTPVIKREWKEIVTGILALVLYAVAKQGVLFLELHFVATVLAGVSLAIKLVSFDRVESHFDGMPGIKFVLGFGITMGALLLIWMIFG